jgi:hypothetical protein
MSIRTLGTVAAVLAVLWLAARFPVPAGNAVHHAGTFMGSAVTGLSRFARTL